MQEHPADHPRLSGLTLVTLGVRDLGAARAFYVDRLGWPVLLDAGEVVFLPLGPALVLSLFGAGDLAADVSATLGAPPGPVTVARNVAGPGEVDAAAAHWQRAGGRVVKAPVDTAWGGRHCYLADPDGFLWEVAHNPGLVVGADGEVHVGEPGA